MPSRPSSGLLRWVGVAMMSTAAAARLRSSRSSAESAAAASAPLRWDFALTGVAATPPPNGGDCTRFYT